ncbi:hypothetical protein [Streptomyces sp. NPDC048386]|uniref:hypothetical protein n=1 Tax=Streptomyces sp. NPDC048386 TaxID=3365541 RepID=UPI00371D24E1
MRIRTATTALLATTLLTLTACSSSSVTTTGNLDIPGQQACNDFATGYKDAATHETRTALASKVEASAKDSTVDRIPDMSKALTRSANSNDEAWKIGADAFAQACLDAGWKAN